MAEHDGQSGQIPPSAGDSPITLVHQGTADDPPRPVDRELLRALVHRRIADQEAREVLRWIQTDKEWDDAYQEALIETLQNITARAEGKSLE